MKKIKIIILTITLLLINNSEFGYAEVKLDDINPIEQQSVNEVINYLEVEATAYCNPNNNKCASGVYPIEGITIAGKREWLGKKCKLYTLDYNLIGEYIFQDTGFGNDLDGNGIGSIQEGTCIDIFMNDYKNCIKWGRKNILIVIDD